MWPGFLTTTPTPSLSSQWHLPASPESSRSPGTLPPAAAPRDPALPRDPAPRRGPPLPPALSAAVGARREPRAARPEEPKTFPTSFPPSFQRAPRARKLRGWGSETTCRWTPHGGKPGGCLCVPLKNPLTALHPPPRGTERSRRPRAARGWSGRSGRPPRRSAGCGLAVIYELQPLFAQLMMRRGPASLGWLARRRLRRGRGRGGSAGNWKPKPSPSPPGHFPFTPRCFIEGWGEALPVP